MHQDPILNNFAFITTFFILLEAGVLLHISHLYGKQKDKKINYGSSILKDPILNQDLSKNKHLYIRFFITHGLLILAVLVLSNALQNPEISNTTVNTVKFGFGVLVFPSLYNTLIGITHWFHLKHNQTDKMIQGLITYSSEYSSKLRAVQEFSYLLIFGLFACITGSAYLWGGAFMFLITCIRDFLTSKRVVKKS